MSAVSASSGLASLSQKKDMSGADAPKTKTKISDVARSTDSYIFTLVAPLAVVRSGIGMRVKGIDFIKLTFGRAENLVRIGTIVFPILDPNLVIRYLENVNQLKEGTCSIGWVRSKTGLHEDKLTVCLFRPDKLLKKVIAVTLAEQNIFKATEEGLLTLSRFSGKDEGALFTARPEDCDIYRFVSVVE